MDPAAGSFMATVAALPVTPGRWSAPPATVRIRSPLTLLSNRVLLNVIAAVVALAAMVKIGVVSSRYSTAWVTVRFTSSAVAAVFERITRNSGFAIPGVASVCSASMVTRGTALLLVTARAENVAASLPETSSTTSPLPGFVYATVTASSCAAGAARVSTTVLPDTLTVSTVSGPSLPPAGVAFTGNAVAAGAVTSNASL